MTSVAGRTRRRLSAEVRREQLESAAIVVVARDGFAATNADAICRHADVSKGLVWHYFDTLDDLLANAARRALGILKTAVADDVARDVGVLDLLRSAVRRSARLPTTHPAELRAVREIASNLRSPDGSPQLGEHEYDELYAAQRALMQRGQREGSIRADLDPHLLAVTYQGLVDTMLGHLAGAPHLDADAYAEHVAAVLTGGIGA